MPNQLKMTPRNFYLWLVSGLGVFLVVRGVFLLPTYDMPLVFALLVLLAIAAQITATSLIGGNVTVEVGTAVSMATISLYGPVAATIVAAAGVTAITIINLRQSWKGWLGAAERIGFNIGMSATAIYLAGLIYHAVLAIFDNNLIIGTMLAWLAAAVVNDQVQLWLRIGLLHLQSGVKPLDIWRQHRWAIPINVLVISVGGGVLDQLELVAGPRQKPRVDRIVQGRHQDIGIAHRGGQFFAGHRRVILAQAHVEQFAQPGLDRFGQPSRYDNTQTFSWQLRSPTAFQTGSVGGIVAQEQAGHKNPMRK